LAILLTRLGAVDDPELRRAVVDEVFNDMSRRSHAN
jgi:hypothetical protein